MGSSDTSGAVGAAFMALAIGGAAYLGFTDSGERQIDATQTRPDTIYADVVYKRFEWNKTENVFQDRLGVVLLGANASNGVNGGACSYAVLRPDQANINRFSKAVDAESGITIGQNLYNVTVKDPTPASGGGFSGQPYVPDTCGIRIASYGTESVPSPLGSAVMRLDARSYIGNFNARERVTLFDGGISIRANILGTGIYNNSPGACGYTAYFDGQELSASSGVAHFMASNGKTYRVDASMNAGGFVGSVPCRLKVTEFERLSERTIYAPVEASAPRRGNLTREEQIAQDFIDHNPVVNVRYGNVVETVSLQPRTRIELQSDAVHYQENSVTFQTEVAWEKGGGNSYGGNGSANIGIPMLFSGSLGGSFERSLSNSVETKVQSGTTRTGGVNLDGSQCRVWETWVEGRRREAFATAPSVGLRDELRFTFTESVMMYARPLCDASGRPLPAAANNNTAPSAP